MSKLIGNVDVLGTEYEIYIQGEKENPKLEGNDGICEWYTKSILIDTDSKNECDTFDNIDAYYHKVLRHEAFHALFHEAGLSDYAKDEKLVDALAILYPKMQKIMETMDNTKLDLWGYGK